MVVFWGRNILLVPVIMYLYDLVMFSDLWNEQSML